MRLTIFPTAEVISIQGSLHRIWTGTDEAGTDVKLAVRFVQPQTHDPEKLAAFEAELEELPQLRPTGIDYRFFVD